MENELLEGGMHVKKTSATTLLSMRGR